jgi:glucose/arabinose dehydrogenase
MQRAVFVGLLAACGGSKEIPDAAPVMRCETPVSGTTVQMQRVAQVNGSAILVTAPPRDLRLFVIEQTGRIRIIDNNNLLPEPFLDLSADVDGPVTCCGERGMLGLAFHPQYATNGQFFVTYTASNSGDPDNPHRNVLARCLVSATDPNRADRASCVDVLSIPDFASNHNGGMIEFGRDGYLYWATGDGGGGGDPNRNGQALEDGNPLPNTKALLGKMLRLDIDNKTAGLEYGIPADNPFATGGGKPEIYMIGLRNAWRWSFDRATGDMWIADVGQGRIEEVTVVRPDQQNGANLGWNQFEASECFNGGPCTATQIAPQIERTHAMGWTSITGGQVYRGSCFPDLAGTYFFTDYDTAGRLSTAKLEANGTVTATDLQGSFPPNGSSIHEDAAGELYETDTSGNVFQLVVVP